MAPLGITVYIDNTRPQDVLADCVRGFCREGACGPEFDAMCGRGAGV